MNLESKCEKEYDDVKNDPIGIIAHILKINLGRVEPILTAKCESS